jgi:peptidylprolyl isomerase
LIRSERCTWTCQAVFIELAPQFAPLHFANIVTLVREHYFDSLAILRAQDNFVVQWGDPDEKRPLGQAQKEVAPEFTVPMDAATPFVPLPDRMVMRPGRLQRRIRCGAQSATRQQWLIHC